MQLQYCVLSVARSNETSLVYDIKLVRFVEAKDHLFGKFENLQPYIYLWINLAGSTPFHF